MNATTLMERINQMRVEGEKANLLKGLSALLIVTPKTQQNARQIIKKAIAYVKEN